MLLVGDPIQELQDDHRSARDGMFELLQALEEGDLGKAREIMTFVNLVAGPHWRWEEETLYPLLERFSEELVHNLLIEHDKVIEAVEGLAEIVGKRTLAAEDLERARKLTLPILYHVATCDGLILWMEMMDEQETQGLRQAIFVARREGVPLLEWAQTVRTRSAS